MTETARIRIGRVKMKAGGADLHIYERPTVPPASRVLRDWVMAITTGDTPPDAIAAASFRWNPETGQYWVSTTWWTTHALFPVTMLPEMTKVQLTADMTEAMVEGRIMRNLGYRPVDPPDGAA